MVPLKAKYDVVIVGGGHNGLVAACYLSMSGQSVLLLEKNSHIGGATWSEAVFPGVDVLLSKYSYLISLFPEQILKDLNITFRTKKEKLRNSFPDIKMVNMQHFLLTIPLKKERLISLKNLPEILRNMDVTFRSMKNSIHLLEKCGRLC